MFPSSVIAGGADTAQELRNAVMADPVVAQHYSDFDLANVRRVTLNAPQLMYVSYRVGNKVFWTKRRLTLAKGETVLTDGRSMARTRCGNRVSALPVRPNALAEPAPEDFNAPELPHAASTPYLAAYSPVPSSSSMGGGSPVSVSSLTPVAPFFPFPGGGGVTIGGGHTSLTSRRRWHDASGRRWHNASGRRWHNASGRRWYDTSRRWRHNASGRWRHNASGRR